MNFNGGLIAFTGETGAGKSIILDAILALVGGKVDATFIRAGAERALVEGVFRIPRRTALRSTPSWSAKTCWTTRRP